MFTILVQYMSYEVRLQITLLYYPLAVEDSLTGSKLLLAKNGRGVNNFVEHSINDLMTHTCVISISSCTLLGSISHNVQDAFFQTWTGFSYSSTSIMSGHLERICFLKLMM
ncbi:hypothetical protein TNCV_5018371 [Trichonephila clavipes]|nr:hypothetical protein TNCV_5018371 [Trichonephila clavipes]